MPDGGNGAETGGCGKGNVGRASGGRFRDNRLEVLGAKLGMGLQKKVFSMILLISVIILSRITGKSALHVS